MNFRTTDREKTNKNTYARSIMIDSHNNRPQSIYFEFMKTLAYSASRAHTRKASQEGISDMTLDVSELLYSSPS